jgi:AcrR family transcriptional regulator
MGKTSGPKTRAAIIIEAFKLFSTKQYDSVTFGDFELATGLSRGAIRYHFKNKQTLFEAVVESSLLNRTAILDIPIPENDVLKSFLLAFIDNCETATKTMAAQGIKNVNLAYYIIESTSLCFFDNFAQRARNMRDVEISVWTQVIKRAMEKQEIRDDMDPKIVAMLFLNLYTGHAYTAAKEENGCEIDQLRNELFAEYEALKMK